MEEGSDKASERDGIPFASVLHRATIDRLAKGQALPRGRAYASEGRVVSLERSRSSLSGRVRGSVYYDVSIWVSGDGLGYACSCPQGLESEFCKHCVAVTFLWLETPR